jgi:hypothetical protein
MAKLEWTWDLEGGVTIRACLEHGIESVFAGPRLLSRSGDGGKAEGHAVSVPGTAAVAHVVFNQDPRSCECSIDGTVVPPSSTPPAPRGGSEGGRTLSIGLRIAAAALALFLVFALATGSFGFHTASQYLERIRNENDPLIERPNEHADLLIASFPPSFHIGMKWGDIMWISRRDVPRINGVVLVATRGGPDSAQELNDEYLRTVGQRFESQGARLDTQEGHASKCYHDDDGYESVSTLHDGNEESKLWMCAFRRGHFGYVFGYLVRASQAYVEEPLLQRILQHTRVLDGDKVPLPGMILQ